VTRSSFPTLAPALVAACLSAAGCSSDPTKGYAFSSSYRTDIQSINVPIFQNTTFSRGIENDLTEAIIVELRKSTPWSVTNADGAQTTLRGSIVSAELKKLSTSRDTGLVEELAVSLTVDFEWKDNRTGQVLVARRGFTSAEPFVPARGTSGAINERIETGQFAAVQELSREIVGSLRASW